MQGAEPSDRQCGASNKPKMGTKYVGAQGPAFVDQLRCNHKTSPATLNKECKQVRDRSTMRCCMTRRYTTAQQLYKG